MNQTFMQNAAYSYFHSAESSKICRIYYNFCCTLSKQLLHILLYILPYLTLRRKFHFTEEGDYWIVVTPDSELPCILYLLNDPANMYLRKCNYFVCAVSAPAHIER